MNDLFTYVGPVVMDVEKVGRKVRSERQERGQPKGISLFPSPIISVTP